MRRILLLVTVALVMATMMVVAKTLPAVAWEPSAGPGQSSCVGHNASTLAREPGFDFGEFASSLAGPGAGQLVSEQAHVQPCPPPEH